MKYYKKIISFVLSLIMVFSVLPLSAFAEESEEIYAPIEFSVTSAKGVEEKSVHVEVRVSENSQIASLTLELLYDSSKLLINNFEAGELFENGLSAINGNVSDKVIASYASMQPIIESGTLFSVDFTVTADINDILDLSLNVVEATDVNSDDLVVSKTDSGSIEVVELLYGDLNFDNRITAVDALMVLSSSTEEIELTEDARKAGDVNGDGNVSVSDALQILYYSAELIDDFTIYHITAPQNIFVKDLDGYQFTVSWDYEKDVFGYNVYLNGELVNEELITENEVSIGVNMAGEYGSDLIPRRIQDKIEQVTTYSIEISAVNALKESDRSAVLPVTTKRIWSWVTFVDWDGTEIKKSRVYYGEDAIVPNNPSRQDYFFIGWDKSTENITDDTVITAMYEDAHYDFVFLNEDGSELYRQDVTVNGVATPPADPQKTGYSFAGWYTALDGGEKITDFSVTSDTGERTAYAHYTINTYNIMFNSMGGSTVSGKTAVYNTTFTAPTAPTRLGYGFAGWYKDSACTNAWNFSSDRIANYDLTLYAKWTPVTITIDKAAVTLNNTGSTSQLNATITGGQDSLEWYSDNTSVATVSSTGLITAKGHGTCTIYVKGVSSDRRPVTKVTVNVAKDAWVTADIGLNLRSSATTASSALCVIPYATKITVYGTGSNGWIAANYNGKNGYVSTDYISYQKPANNATSTLTGTFQQKIDKLKNEFPNGKYWNHLANSYHNNLGQFHNCTDSRCNNPNGCTDHPCTTHNGAAGVGQYDCNTFDGAIQCCGFAKYIYWRVWEQHTYSGQKISSPSFSKIKAGDFVGIDRNKDGDPAHYLFVIEKRNDCIITVEGNVHHEYNCSDCNCKIKWDRVRYANTQTITEIIRPR